MFFSILFVSLNPEPERNRFLIYIFLACIQNQIGQIQRSIFYVLNLGLLTSFVVQRIKLIPLGYPLRSKPMAEINKIEVSTSLY